MVSGNSLKVSASQTGPAAKLQPVSRCLPGCFEAYKLQLWQPKTGNQGLLHGCAFKADLRTGAKRQKLKLTLSNKGSFIFG